MPKNALVKVQGTQQFMGKEIPVVLGGFGENQKVVADKTIAEIHNTTPREIRKSINRNIKRFKENVDFIDLKQRGDEITTLEILDKLGYSKQAITLAENIYLLSERGYAKLIKIMDTDLAWDIHDQLMDEYFHLREEKQQMQSMSMEDIIIYQMQQSKMMKEQLEQTQTVAIEAKATAEQATKQMEIVKDAMLLDHDSWRKDCNNIINKVAKERGGTKEAYQQVRDEVYNLLQQRAGASLKTRVINKQDRMRREGISKSKVDKVSQIDVIAEDKRLKEIYIAVVKEMAIKYGVA
ncbi:ORF6N domain-containing protein [Zhenhengia yiwuensis]|uniref:ORF6N domain-containing protein n=1 Tax=Zhenhengia yiwuensis TaxID=2763666 RepID=UPI002A75DA85|nr:ORF6N domain-containing protein [Zhenhengia yiwuensis]MDY3368928.1 ORF6N domain-containing protein [Zhenhengia yiwuensis]